MLRPEKRTVDQKGFTFFQMDSNGMDIQQIMFHICNVFFSIHETFLSVR